MSWFSKLNLISNRRKQRRLNLSKAKYAVAFQLDDQVSTGWLLDVSNEGARLCLHDNVLEQIRDNQHYAVRIKTFDDHESLVAKIGVIWKEYDAANDMTILGCQFAPLNVTQTQILECIITAHS